MDIILDQTGFNKEYWSRFTEAEFIRLNPGLYLNYSPADRITLLKIAYQKIIQ